jgi:hypothetical protein
MEWRYEQSDRDAVAREFRQTYGNESWTFTWEVSGKTHEERTAEMEAAWYSGDIEGAHLDGEDRVCSCGHWHDEHGPKGCGCGCSGFVYDPAQNTPTAIADRGGDPELWPEHIKRALGR